jgi:hypothetical protein
VRSPRLPALLLSFAVVPASIALPVLPGLHLSHAKAHPVRAVVHSLALSAAQRDTATARFALVGATYSAGDVPDGARIEVRVRQDGHWSSWSQLDETDSGPDNGSPDARHAAGRLATEPLWVGHADGVQARLVRGATALTPRGIALSLIDPGTSDADATVSSSPVASTAWASTLQPAIYTRAQWGADESLRRGACPEGPDYNNTIKVGFVHHTDTENGYSSSEVPAILRSIYAYHVKGNGWCDIGYNFLIDRFGRIWEGRYGGVNKAVVGAHTGGFNTDSFGVAAIGTYTTTNPPSAMLSAYERLFAWKFALYFRDPTGTDRLISGGGGTDKWPVGQSVSFHRIAGHRDAGNTTCPGSDLYAKLGTLRSGTRSLMGAIPAPSGDYTGDLKTDPATWDPATGSWHIGTVSSAYRFGTKGDLPVPGNYVAGNLTERAVFRPSTGRWYVDAPHQASHEFGTKGDVPVPADYNGDRITDRAVFRPSTGRWYVDLPGWRSAQWGAPGDIPVPADYNGDGKAEYAMWRPSTGTWWVYGSPSITWGARTDIPVPGDYDGDGRVDRAVWRAGNGGWYVYGGRTLTEWGTTGDIPVPGGFNGSAIATPAAYRVSTGRWYLSGAAAALVGATGFEPLVLPYAIYRAIPQ